jgi:hypothetical protein
MDQVSKTKSLFVLGRGVPVFIEGRDERLP